MQQHFPQFFQGAKRHNPRIAAGKFIVTWKEFSERSRSISFAVWRRNRAAEERRLRSRAARGPLESLSRAWCSFVYGMRADSLFWEEFVFAVLSSHYRDRVFPALPPRIESATSETTRRQERRECVNKIFRIKSNIKSIGNYRRSHEGSLRFHLSFQTICIGRLPTTFRGSREYSRRGSTTLTDFPESRSIRLGGI